MAISTEKKVGLFFLLALTAFGVLIEAVEDWNPFEDRVPYHAYFDSVVGIRNGDPVRMAGVDVGKVKAIDLEAGRVRVSFEVRPETQVKVDSLAGIRQTNLLGGQFLGLEFGSAEAPVLPPGSTVPSVERTNIDQLIANLDRNQEKVLGELGLLIDQTRGPLTDTVVRLDSIVRKIDEGDGLLGKLINEPDLYEDVEATLAGLRGVIGRLESGEGTLGRLLHDPALYDITRTTVTNLRDLTARVQAGEGSLGKLLVDEELYRNSALAMARWGEVAERMTGGEGTLGKLLHDEALYEETRLALQRIRSIAEKIDRGEGTIGRLINEDDLYREAKTTLHKVEKTVDGMSDTGPLSALGVVLGTMF